MKAVARWGTSGVDAGGGLDWTGQLGWDSSRDKRVAPGGDS